MLLSDGTFTFSILQHRAFMTFVLVRTGFVVKLRPLRHTFILPPLLPPPLPCLTHLRIR